MRDHTNDCNNLSGRTDRPRGRRWGLGGVLLVGAAIIGPTLWAQTPRSYRHAIDDPLGLQRSQVYGVIDPHVIFQTTVDRKKLIEMLNTGIRKMAGTDDVAAAWRAYISEEDIVALKFNPVGSRELGTNGELALALLTNFEQLGYSPDHFLIVGLDETPEEFQGRTRAWEYGWQAGTADFGSGSDHLPLWLDEITAIINLPSVMDDNMIGLNGTLANLSLAMIKSPGHLYLNHGDPFIPEIYELPQIRDKVRLHLANALQLLYYGGPVADPLYIHELQALIFSDDPVALDRVAHELIRSSRRRQILPEGISETFEVPYLETAQTMGLGYYDLNFIDDHKLKRFKKAVPAMP